MVILEIDPPYLVTLVGLTLVRFSTQPEPLLTQNTLQRPPDTP